MIQNTQRSHLAVPWLVIVNPQSANGRIGKEWPIWEKRLRSLLPQMEVQISPKANSATRLVMEGVRQGIRHILAVGGDGTAHQVVNGIIKSKGGDDFVMEHGLHMDIRKNCVPFFEEDGAEPTGVEVVMSIDRDCTGARFRYPTPDPSTLPSLECLNFGELTFLEDVLDEDDPAMDDVLAAIDAKMTGKGADVSEEAFDAEIQTDEQSAYTWYASSAAGERLMEEEEEALQSAWDELNSDTSSSEDAEED